jgi:hypothetical protein
MGTASVLSPRGNEHHAPGVTMLPDVPWAPFIIVCDVCGFSIIISNCHGYGSASTEIGTDCRSQTHCGH